MGVNGTILKTKSIERCKYKRIYAKFGREIYVAAKQGEPDQNQTKRLESY